MTEKSFPARIHVLLARDAPIGLIIRRGPSKSVCIVLWDREHDSFELGQWLRGRIYERRCDLSPDGKYFIYFAMNGHWKSKTKGSWTAISRVPYVKAVTLLAKGDCWHGGGLFLTKNTFWLNDGYGHKPLLLSHDVTRDETYKPPVYYGGECLTVYYNRLQRDGWTLRSHDQHGSTVFEKELPNSWVLRKFAFAELGAPAGRGCYWDAHELKHEATETSLTFPEWEWAELDRKRLVWAANGELRAARLGDGKLVREQVLHNFNDMRFEAIAAPY
jgi:hypothetical protein